MSVYIPEDQVDPDGINNADVEASDELYPSLTFDGYTDGIMVDDDEALVQSIYKRLTTPLSTFPGVYDENYGLYIDDLIGNAPDNIVQTILTQRITDCLSVEDRVVSVDSVEFDIDSDQVSMCITVTTVDATQVSINVEL